MALSQGAWDPLEPFRSEAERMLREALAALGAPDEAPKLARAPEGRGDFALACHPLAARLRKQPQAVAQELAAALPRSELLAARPEGPYLNFSMAPAPLALEVLRSALARGAAYGHAPPSGQRVIVEHTSANPTGPLHVGRARNPIIGDTLVRLLRAAGHEATGEYYVNDMGKQVVTLVWGAQHFQPGELPAPERAKPDHELVGAYRKASELLESQPDVERAVAEMLQRYERGDAEMARLARATCERMLEGLRASLERVGVRLDAFAWESEFVLRGDVERALARLKRSERCQEEAGALYLDMEGLGIAGKSQKFFLTRADGTTLYTMRDIAYHLDKFARAGRLVNVVGEDHKLPMRQLGVALKLLGLEKEPECVFYAFVSLPDGRMSTRKGRVVYLDDLLDEAEERALAEVKKRRGDELTEEEMRRIARIVGVGAVRFNIVAVQAEKPITFRWEEALDFEGASAPSVQYAHARASSLLRKAREQELRPGEPRPEVAAMLREPSEVALLRVLARLPSLVEQCAAEVRAHPVATYAVEAARAFNQFYRDSPVLQAPAGLREARLALVLAAKHVLHNALDLLGIEAPESM